MSLDREYWETSLHCDYEEEINKAKNITSNELEKNSKITNRALSIFLNSSGTRNQLISILLEDREILKEFLLLKDFSDKSHQDIVGKVVEGNLTNKERRSLVKSQKVRLRDYSKYDKFSLLFSYIKKIKII